MRHAVPHAAMQAYQPESAIHSAVFFLSQQISISSSRRNHQPNRA
jgi:hypothetical protein